MKLQPREIEWIRFALRELMDDFSKNVSNLKAAGADFREQQANVDEITTLFNKISKGK